MVEWLPAKRKIGLSDVFDSGGSVFVQQKKRVVSQEMAGSGLGKFVFSISLRDVQGDWQELDGLTVEVSEVLYVPTLEAPEDKPHPFVYFINVINDSQEQVTLHGRKWIVREHDGELTVLEGEGIVGQRPVIGVNDRYSYNSYHVVAGSGTAWGAFYGITDSGKRITVKIPEFGMAVPGWV